MTKIRASETFVIDHKVKTDNEVFRPNENKTLKLNVRGFLYKINSNTLLKHPNTRLGKLANALKYEDILKLCDEHDLELNEFYFNRDPLIFNKILNYYVTNKLHLYNSECVIQLKEELDYWQIDENCIQLCCRRLYDEQMSHLKIFQKNVTNILKKLEYKEDFGKNFYPEFRRKLWNLFEKPDSSIFAKVNIYYSFLIRSFLLNIFLLLKILFYFTLILIFLSTIEFILTSLPEFDEIKMSSNYCTNITNLLNVSNYHDANCSSIEYVSIFISNNN
jgi:hypothetical protein